MRRFALLIPLLVAPSACFDDASVQSCDPGSAGCVCQQSQCDPGLSCVDNQCVSSSETDGGSGAGTTVGTTTTTTTGSGATSSMPTSSTTDDPSTSSTGPESTSGSTGSTGSTGQCGDGVLDPDEECDGGPGCSNTCQLENYGCNPLTNVPCADGQKCSYSGAGTDFNYMCLPFSTDPPGQIGEGSCFNVSPRDEWCDIGLACTEDTMTPTCSDPACCVQYCDLTDDRFQCQSEGDECIPALGPLSPEGLANLGWCIAPS